MAIGENSVRKDITLNKTVYEYLLVMLAEESRFDYRYTKPTISKFISKLIIEEKERRNKKDH
ncbi:hypothetical protein [Isobaculum melis]|nr:hypothetical protein [Isobaculum melis]